MHTTQQTHIIHSADRPRFTLFGALHQLLVSLVKPPKPLG
jgi:hypothetical protein